ncbi:glycosyl transferase family 2 [Rhodonellum psychrophilum GCM71 = DSM 17998]|uniref:Glycosyl transferase family 2 n=2 Tax=Rhodonellum TaxID=336827 RepID=U5BUQ9_9BACT|nr:MULTISPECIES: cellulose synthase family protein [Rhodonellum]ERM84340.1 glycosyl transferase family 2 [Rhodonellum psychrophilum GCM71 = DSM 17998]SDZ42954.1 Glycosyltransferase, catalytic subunit of cellulose synthase and poly-beta-1,6-N-acetylglucosamine synthase [Rhodonellum ikkaensis]
MILIYFFLAVYVLAMLFILLYSFAQAHLLYHFFRFKKKLKPLSSPDWDSLPMVTVQLPIFNEQYVVERLIDSLAAFRYPKEKLEIQILDDSTDETADIIKKHLQNFPELNFKYIHRVNRQGFKAGALKEGLKKAEGEFIAIFDADFVPDSDFLLKTLGFFADSKVGMVQTRWTHLNENYSVLTRLQAFALDAHFMVEQMGRNSQDAFINFNGTGGIWRKSCILDAGNWQDDTLTEDLDLSYRAQKKGWKFVYRPDIESPAELPPVMSAIKSQQFRWTKGGAECAAKHLGSVLRDKFPFKVKLHAAAHLLNSVIFIAVLFVSLSSIPVWWAFLQGWIPDVYFQGAAVFLIGFVIIAGVYFFANLSLLEYSLGSFLRFLWELPLFLSVSMGLGIHNTVAVWEGLTGKKSAFIRTPKYNLESNKSTLGKNVYNQMKIPFTTYLEGLMAIVFTVLVAISIITQTYEMLVFHVMLAIGYGLVSWESFKSYRMK